MTTKTSADQGFHCVDFKRQSQERLLQEYEVRKGEFRSYGHFIRAKILEDEWSRDMWQRTAPQPIQPREQSSQR